MNLERDLIWFDLETTGPNVFRDRIIEIAAKKIKPNGEIEELYSKFNPIIPIDKEATEKHGYTNADLVEEPIFNDKAQMIFAFFQNADLAGYNIKKFDVPFLVEEFLRSKLIWNLTNVKIYDTFRIWAHFEGRTLTDAYRRFCNKELTNAHSAMADIEASMEIAKVQEELFKFNSIDEANDYSLYEKEKISFDLAGKIIIKDDIEYITFGKYENKSFKEVLLNDPSYIDWCCGNENFPQQSKIAFKILKQKYSKVTA